MIEKERKFLPNLQNLPIPINIIKIKQAYLIAFKRWHLRVRIVDETVAYMTFKFKPYLFKYFYEIEFKLNLKIARHLYNFAKYKLEKERQIFVKNSQEEIIMDVYSNNLKIIEIEYKDDLAIIPDYCNVDVTNQEEYKNYNLARRNI